MCLQSKLNMTSFISKCISKYTSINRMVRFITLFFLWPFAMFFMLIVLKMLTEIHTPVILLALVIPELVLCTALATIGILFLVEWHAQALLRIKNVILCNAAILAGGAWFLFCITDVSEYFFSLFFKN